MSQPTSAQERAAQRTWRAHLRDLRSFDAELNSILTDAAREADRMLRNLLPDTGIGAQVRRAQLQVAANAIREFQANLFNGPITEAMRRAIERTSFTAFDGIMTLNRLLLEADMPISLSESFEWSARRAAEHLRSRLINNIDLSPRVYRTRALSQRWVQREINRGLALGRSADEIARSVRALISPSVRGGVDYAARRLGRTEINNAFHTTTIRMASNQPWTEGFKWMLSDSHTRPDPCDTYAKEDHDDLGDGVFAKGNVPGKPHPQCLCYLVVVTVGEDEFLNNLVGGRYDRFLRQSP